MELPRVVPPTPWGLDDLKRALIQQYPCLATEEGLGCLLTATLN